MIPVLLHFGFIKIYTLGVFLVIAFLASAFLLWKNLKITSYKEEEIFDGLFLSMIGAFFGGRLIYVLLNFDKFGFSVLKFILINGYPGISMFGALLGGFITLLLFTHPRKISFLELSEYVVSPLFLGLAIAKVGSFLSGADIGTQTTFLLSVKYVGASGLRHIVAIYEAILFLIGFFVTHRILFIVRRDRAKAGTSLILFIIYYGLVELILDNLKQNHLYLSGLSFNSLAGGVLFVIGTILLLTTYRSNIIYVIKHLFSKTKKHDNRASQQSSNGGTETSTPE